MRSPEDVVKARVDRAPALNEIGEKSFRFAYEMIAHGVIVARAETVQVMYDYANSRTKPLSDAQREAMLSFEEKGSVRVRE